MYHVCLHVFIIVLNNGILRMNVSKKPIYYLYKANLYYNQIHLDNYYNKIIFLHLPFFYIHVCTYIWYFENESLKTLQLYYIIL